MRISRKLSCIFLTVLFISPITLPTVQAQQSEAGVIEEIVIIGSRRQDGRSQTESLVPVDVFGGEDLSNMGSTDMDAALSNLIPSYKVDRQAINDAATLVRPATLRGLPPDSTLVLVNGKRRHRASVITFLGNGVADGSQGPDVSVIPSIALKRVEVLRDGAAAQYGSDAIAGVINFELKDDAEGGAVEARWGQHYEGDGDGFNFAGNVGLPMSSNGFLNLSMEYKEADPTSRAFQRPDAQALADAGNPHIDDPGYEHLFHPTVMVWGSPEFKYDYKFFGNMGIDLSDSFEVYGYGNYAKRKVEGGFYFRNPHTRSGVFNGPVVAYDSATGDVGEVLRQRDGESGEDYKMRIDSRLEAGTAIDTVKVADVDGIGVGGSCPAIRIMDNVANAGDIAAIEARPDCESFITRFPGGFVPRFGGTMEDYSAAFGVRGDLPGDWHVDVGGVYGRHKASYFMRHTINPQLLAMPRYFGGKYSHRVRTRGLHGNGLLHQPGREQAARPANVPCAGERGFWRGTSPRGVQGDPGRREFLVHR